jgi:hypothetical protein
MGIPVGCSQPWNQLTQNPSCKTKICSFKIPAEKVENTTITIIHGKVPNSTANSLNGSTIEATS